LKSNPVKEPRFLKAKINSNQKGGSQMNEKKLSQFIDRQKRSSWCSVEEKTLNGKTVREAFPARRAPYEKLLINMLDADKCREKKRNRKH